MLYCLCIAACVFGLHHLIRKASAMGGPMGSATGMGTGASPQSSFSPPSGDAEKIKEEAIMLHRAGEYEAAAREFSRAAELLEAARTGGGSAPALNAVRLSLAAAQLKVWTKLGFSGPRLRPCSSCAVTWSISCGSLCYHGREGVNDQCTERTCEKNLD